MTVEELLPKEWVECDLNQLLDYVTSGSRDWSQYYSDAGVNFIRTQDINQNRLDLSSVAKVRLPEKVEGKRTLVRKDDILITITGANVGKCARVDFSPPESYVSQSVALVRLIDPSMSAFIQRQIIAPVGDQTALQKAAYGMGRPVLNLNNIREFKVKFPPQAEQKIIAEKLDTLLAQVDNTKARLERIPEILKRFRQSVLAAAVSGKLTKEWRSGRQFKTSSEELSRLAKFIDYRGKTPTKTDSGIPLITAKNIRPGFISREPREFIAHEDYESWMTRGIPNFGDVLITTEAPMGYVANIDIEEKFALAQRAICLQFTANINPYFASIYMQASEFQKALDENATGSTVKGIKAALLKKIQITYPRKDEQTEIVRRVEELITFADRIEQSAQAALNRVNNLTQSILAKAFRGELTADWRAANPELISGENSAEALLARIKAERAMLSKKTKPKA